MRSVIFLPVQRLKDRSDVVDRNMPETSSIRTSVSIEHRLVTDRWTDRHRATAST